MKNKRLVVLGGSRGIGLSTAQQALARGADVVLIARGRGDLDAARDALLREMPAASLETHTLDASDAAATGAVFAALDPFDYLYVAAGSFVGGALREQRLDMFRAVFDARIWGAAAAIQNARFREGGAIVLTGGLSTARPAVGAWATAVATAAAEHAARALAVELAPLRVNAVSPGWTDTPMWDGVFPDDATKRNAFANAAAHSLTGAIASPEHVAHAVLFLLENPSITGEVLHIDAGQRFT